MRQVVSKQMYLKRKIYDRLVQWKESADHSTLEVNGARQVGKTLECYKQATQWQTGQKRPEHPLHDAFYCDGKLFGQSI